MSLWRVSSLVEAKSVHPLCSADLKTQGCCCWPRGRRMVLGVEEMGQSKVRRLEEMDNPSLWLCFPELLQRKTRRGRQQSILRMKRIYQLCSSDKYATTTRVPEAWEISWFWWKGATKTQDQLMERFSKAIFMSVVTQRKWGNHDPSTFFMSDKIKAEVNRNSNWEAAICHLSVRGEGNIKTPWGHLLCL